MRRLTGKFPPRGGQVAAGGGEEPEEQAWGKSGMLRTFVLGQEALYNVAADFLGSAQAEYGNSL